MHAAPMMTSGAGRAASKRSHTQQQHQQQQQQQSRPHCRRRPSAAAAAPSSRPSRRRPDAAAAAAPSDNGGDPSPVLLINSVSGQMGQAVARAALRAGIEIYPSTLVATDAMAAEQPSIPVRGTAAAVAAVGPSHRDAELARALEAHGARLVAVDYTAPDAVHDMADLYQRHGVPFVMGTTGGDRARLLDEARASGCFAVIAPQMGKQIVAFQAMLEMAAEAFPGAFAGYTLSVVESHQATKKDTSGTAKAVVASLLVLGAGGTGSPLEPVPAAHAAAAAAGPRDGDADEEEEDEEDDRRRRAGGNGGRGGGAAAVATKRGERAAAAAAARLRSAPFSSADIAMVRDPAHQVSEMGVPPDALQGHAFHTYRLVAPDGSVAVELQHNVVGRSVYAEGSVDAALFLARRVAEAARGGGDGQRVYNMVDVLRAGAMR